MADWQPDLQGTPSAPSAGSLIVFPDSVTNRVSSIDPAGQYVPYTGVLFTSLTADFTGTNVNTAQPVFTAAVDTFTTVAAQSYMMNAAFHIHTTGTTSHTFGVLFGGTATLTSIGYQAICSNAATEVLGADSVIWAAVATIIVLTPATATATHHSVVIKGIVRVNGAGTFIPQYQWSAAPGTAGVTLANSYFSLIPIGINTVASVGNWS